MEREETVKFFPADALFIEPIPFLKYLISTDDRKSEYLKCPAVTDFFKNTFVVLSPVDAIIKYDKESDMLHVSGQGIGQDLYDAMVVNRGNQIRDNDKFLMTFGIPQILLYSKKNVVLESLPTFMAYKSCRNYNIIPGKFNISKWIRPVDFTFEFIDENHPITLKRGDPIFAFRLTPDDDSKVELIRELNKFKEDWYLIGNFVQIKKFLPRLTLNNAYKLAEPIIDFFWKSRK